MEIILSTNVFMDYKDFRRYSNVFIETGSGQGDGIQRALTAGFDHISSVEAYYENFMVCARRFVGNKRVRLCHGQSVHVLPTLLGSHAGPCVFFLDAHPSESNSFGFEQWQRGEVEYFQDTIIRGELAIILQDARRHVIIIDDMHGGSRDCAFDYAEIIQRAKGGYTFSFYDENLSGDNPRHFYKDKLLVAVPE